MLILYALQSPLQAQPPSFNFHQLGTANGLSDPAVRGIAQDKYGYIWIATSNGLNRFNGYEVKLFQHQQDDSLSLRENPVYSVLTDDTGNLWVAQPKGIYRYDYATSHFIFQKGSAGISSGKMVQAGKTTIYLATATGMVLFNTATGHFSWLKDTADTTAKKMLSWYVNDFCLQNERIYIATDSGVVIYNRVTGKTEQPSFTFLKNTFIDRIAAGAANEIWVSYGYFGVSLVKTDHLFEKYKIYDQFTLPHTGFTDNRITSIFSDSKGRIWLSSSRFGLSFFNAAADSFISYRHDPLQVTSISDNLTTMIFQDKQGYIWIGTEVSGVDYVHPDKTFFRSIQPSLNQSPTLPDYWCRAAGEDKDGNLWLGTGRGLAKYNPKTNTYSIFQNTNDKTNSLQYNSIRSVLCDGDLVWIGTGNGLNRYHLSTGKMDFIGEKENIPVSFFWTIFKDHENNIWFGCREGIYRFNAKSQAFESMVNHPQLGKYASINTLSIYEDSRHRMWFGFNSKGLMMYDPAMEQTTWWRKNDQDLHSLSDDHVTSITEDKKGVIWIGSMDGLNSYDENTHRFNQYLRNNGMGSEKTACLRVDNQNRLWLAGSKGLYMLDSARKFFTPFDISNGLPTVDFNYQSAFRLKNGDFIYPTLKGFVLFNPASYSNTNDITDSYIGSFTVYGKKTTTLNNFEEKKEIALASEENFFSIAMIGLNYGNPKEIWYAHQLEPFDKEWVYSKERTVNYTNVPGGEYVFHYKTSADINKWNTPEKTIVIHLATIFYKTWWFRLLLSLIVAAILISLYMYRISQKEKVFTLQSKANSLEKEKVLVMYESLKQQLNPHFLFNSLTSLSGLITSNPAHAKQFLDRMSKIYRYILKSRDNETVALIEELKLAEIYTQLQQTRFREGLLVHMDIPEEYLHRKIAPVTIQNLIENAIKHNIIDTMRPLVIDVFIKEDHLIVQNNLQKKKFVETSNKHGLASLQSLYQYLSGKPLVITETENYFTVKIPLI